MESMVSLVNGFWERDILIQLLISDFSANKEINNLEFLEDKDMNTEFAVI